MLGKCFFIMCLASVFCAVYNGSFTDISNAVIDGAAASVDLTLALAGNMCLWCGIMEVLRKAGIIGKFSKILSPLLRHVFPDAWKKGDREQHV